MVMGFLFTSFGTAFAQTAQQPAEPEVPPVTQSSVRFRKEYVLSPGDQIEIVVRRVPEASRTVTIRPDGFISLPILDDVKAAGLTMKELDDALTESLAERLLEPEVTVIATQVRQPMVYVVGEVNNATAVPLRDAVTVMQAITIAGGFRRSAKSNDVAVIRLAEDGRLQAIPLAIKQNEKRASYLAMGNTPLQADDVIYVPENFRSKFARFLDDFVNRPLASVTGVVGTYATFRFVQVIGPQ